MNPNCIHFLLAAAVATASVSAQQRTEVAAPKVEFDAKAGALTVRAKGQLVSALLRTLQQDHGVRVTVVGLQDRAIDVDFANAPLPDALSAMLGAGESYQLDLGEHDVDVPAPRAPLAATAKRSDPADATAGRPRMEDGAPVRTDLPVRSDTVSASRSARGRFMAPAATIFANPVIEANESHDANAAPQEFVEGRHACLVLQVRRDRTVLVDRIVEQPGPAVQGKTVVGEWLYEVRVGDDVIAVGSMLDPLVMAPVCSERPNDPRRRFRMAGPDSARVVLLVDERLLDPAVRARTTVRFHELRDGSELPAELTPATFAAFRSKSVQLTEVGAEALLQTRIDRK